MKLTDSQIELTARRYCHMMNIDPDKEIGPRGKRHPRWQEFIPVVMSHFSMTVSLSSVLNPEPSVINES